MLEFSSGREHPGQTEALGLNRRSPSMNRTPPYVHESTNLLHTRSTDLRIFIPPTPDARVLRSPSAKKLSLTNN